MAVYAQHRSASWVQREPPVLQYVSIASWQHWREPGSIFFAPSLQVFIIIDNIPPVPFLKTISREYATHTLISNFTNDWLKLEKSLWERNATNERMDVWLFNRKASHLHYHKHTIKCIRYSMFISFVCNSMNLVLIPFCTFLAESFRLILLRDLI